MSGYGTNVEAPELSSPNATLQRMITLLKAKDDTSRFVGLALLKSVLDNQPQLRDDITSIKALWEAISPKFLDRLLRAVANDKATKEEARNMVDLAVSVLHTFTVLLPEDARADKRLTGRVGSLVNALVHSSSETTILLLQVLLSCVSQTSGASELIHIEDLSPLIEISSQQPMALDILSYAWSTASLDAALSRDIATSLDRTLPSLLLNFKDTDSVTLIKCIGEVLPRLDSAALPDHPKWLFPLVVNIRNLVASRPTSAGRAAYTSLSAALLQVYPRQSPDLLFRDDKAGANSEKPFSYLFINLLLIDIRSSFPALLPQLNSADYPEKSQHLANAFDIISGFIGFLVKSLDDEGDNQVGSFSMPPDLFLKLRKDIAETMSLAIEYLRDRYDASTAGAPGLHPSARTGTTSTSEGTRLTLTWESMKDNLQEDPVILASIRTLAIWLREDENENLRNESAALMDLLMDLYKNPASKLDYRYPILTALEGIMTTEEGVERFLGQDGWATLTFDLASVLQEITSFSGSEDQVDLSEDPLAARGIEIVRVLLAVIDHEATTEPRDDWMLVVKKASSMKRSEIPRSAMVLELQIAVLQLATALLAKGSIGMQRRYARETTAIIGLSGRLRQDVEKYLHGRAKAELIESLDDVLISLEDMR